jgi:putative spermidine/putrescine transport system permease protein
VDRKRQAFLLALPASLVLLVFFIVPMVYILVKTIVENGFADFVEFFTDPFYLDILWTTIRVSLISTFVSLVLGYPTAYFMARTKSRMKKVMIIIILFPFLVSAVVRSYGWMVLLGTKGLVNQLLTGLGLIEKPLKMLNTEFAVIVGMIHLLIPYMVLALLGVLQSIDPNVEYAAYSLGANPL